MKNLSVLSGSLILASALVTSANAGSLSAKDEAFLRGGKAKQVSSQTQKVNAIKVASSSRILTKAEARETEGAFIPVIVAVASNPVTRGAIISTSFYLASCGYSKSCNISVNGVVYAAAMGATGGVIARTTTTALTTGGVVGHANTYVSTRAGMTFSAVGGILNPWGAARNR